MNRHIINQYPIKNLREYVKVISGDKNPEELKKMKQWLKKEFRKNN